MTESLREDISAEGATGLALMVAKGVETEVRSLLAGSHGAPIDAALPMTELGLDSLSSITLRHNIQKRFNITLAPDVFYECPNISRLAAHVVTRVLRGQSSRTRQWYTGLSPSDQRPLSQQQRRWLELRRLGYGRFTVPILFRARLNPERLEQAFRAVRERHEILRWAFVGDVAATVVNEGPTTLQVDAADGMLNDAVTQALAQLATEVFGETRGISWGAVVVRLDDSRFLVLIVTEHLALDGVSVAVLARELHDLYFGRATAPEGAVSKSYAEFVELQRDYLAGELAVDRAFFEGLYTARSVSTLLPGRSDLLATRASPSTCLSRTTGEVTWEALVRASRVHGVSPFSVLCAGYCKLISEIVAGEDVCIGTIVAGRPPGFERTVGSFATPFPLCIHSGARQVWDLAAEINRIVAAINGRAWVPPGELQDCAAAFSKLPPDTYFTEPFIMFNSHQAEHDDATASVTLLNSLELENIPEMRGVNILPAVEVAGLFLIIDLELPVLRLSFLYDRTRFERDGVAVWARRYESIVASALGSTQGV